MNALAILRWLLAHAASAPTIIERARAVVEAEGIADTWSAVKSFGDYVLPLLEDFPVNLAADAHSYAAMSDAEHAYTTAGLDLAEFRSLLPVLLKLLPLLLDLTRGLRQ